MLWAVCLAPLLTALLFRFGIPQIENLLRGYLQRQEVLSSYYLLFDLFLCFMPSYMFCFASAMVMLTERDENMARYIAVTPVGKKGYVLSRLVLPAVIAMLVSIVMTRFFALTAWDFGILSAACLLMSLLSMTVALLIFTSSRNRVEGMVISKMSGLLVLGLAAPFFMLSDMQYLFSFMPSFWVAKLCLEGNYLVLLPGILISLAWIWPFYRRFDSKLY
jgi:fluoroquinolone transport system permease protein